MVKHTPGPWFYDEDFQLIETDDGQFLASMKFSQSPAVGAAGANGKLIAAAPELLQALREIADDYEDRFDLDDPSTNPGIKLAIKQARAAITKAEGGAA